MDLRKIIQEEIKDFEWLQNTSYDGIKVKDMDNGVIYTISDMGPDNRLLDLYKGNQFSHALWRVTINRFIDEGKFVIVDDSN